MSAVVVAGSVALLLPNFATAADVGLEQRMAGTPRYDTVIYWGADGAFRGGDGRGYGADTGFVTALNGDIGSTGWTLGGNLNLSRTTAPLSSTDSFGASLLLGHQWHAPGYYFSLAGGVNYVHNDETPGGGPTDGDKVGAIVQYGIETKNVDALYLQSYGAYSTAFDQVYFHAKAGYKTPGLRFGGEFTAFDDKGSRPTLRYGAFVGDVPLGGGLSMVVSAGYQQERDPGKRDGFYTTVGFSVPLSLR